MVRNEAQSVLHVACAADAAYFKHCAAMLASLSEFNRGAHVHVLCGADVSADDRQTLTSWGVQRGIAVDCMMPDVLLPNGPPALARVSSATWLRMFLPELFPSVSRLLYLDVDVLIRDSLQELMTLDLRGNWLGAVNDIPAVLDGKSSYLRMGFTEASEYFNAGVLLMDLDSFRRERIGERCLEQSTEDPDRLLLGDQDRLNAVTHGHRFTLPLRWNVTSHIYEGGASQLPFPEAEIREAIARPAIVHYSGDWKPWHYRSKHPLRHLYAEYRKQTPWPDWRLDGQTLKHRVLRLMPVRVQRKLSEWYRSSRSALRIGARK